MIGKHINWKLLIWAVAIGTLILFAVTTIVFQHNVEAIDQELGKIRTNEIE